MRYIEEYYGDVTPTITIICHDCSLVRDLQNTAVTKAIKKAEICTERLVKALNLAASISCRRCITFFMVHSFKRYMLF